MVTCVLSKDQKLQKVEGQRASREPWPQCLRYIDPADFFPVARRRSAGTAALRRRSACSALQSLFGFAQSLDSVRAASVKNPIILDPVETPCTWFQVNRGHCPQTSPGNECGDDARMQSRMRQFCSVLSPDALKMLVHQNASG